MHDAPHVAAGVGADRQHEAAAADGVVGVRKVGGEVGISQLALDSGLELAGQSGLVPARGSESRGGFVAELTALVEAAHEAGHELGARLEGLGEGRECGKRLAPGPK